MRDSSGMFGIRHSHVLVHHFGMAMAEVMSPPGREPVTGKLTSSTPLSVMYITAPPEIGQLGEHRRED